MIDSIQPERIAIPGDVDFTMMYAAHDAFARHLQLVIDGVQSGRRPAAKSRWELFAHQLHVHHTAEDELLWPSLDAAVQQADEVAVLEDMEREHAVIDPLSERIGAGFVSGTETELLDALGELHAGLTAHMRHEENAALPLVATYLGRAGWGTFAAGIRRMQGVSGAATYLPWLLDSAEPATTAAVLKVLPAPARRVYRLVWRRKYRRSLG